MGASSHLTDHTIYGLEVCSELLSRHSSEKILNLDDLKVLDNEVIELLDDLFDADIEPSLKSFIVTRLEEIHLAIIDYEFAGPKPLRRAVESVVGSALFEKEKYVRFSGTEHSKPFWTIIGRAALIVTIVSGTLQITDGLKKLLPEQDVPNIEEISAEMQDVKQDGFSISLEAKSNAISDSR